MCTWQRPIHWTQEIRVHSSDRTPQNDNNCTGQAPYLITFADEEQHSPFPHPWQWGEGTLLVNLYSDFIFKCPTRSCSWQIQTTMHATSRNHTKSREFKYILAASNKVKPNTEYMRLEFTTVKPMAVDAAVLAGTLLQEAYTYMSRQRSCITPTVVADIKHRHIHAYIINL